MAGRGILAGMSEADEGAIGQQSSEIQVVMTPGIQKAFRAWLGIRGLYLFPIPTEDERLPAFGIGIG